MRRTPFHFVTVEQAAELLRINKHTLYRAVARGEVPVRRVGPYIKIPTTWLLLTPPQIETVSESFYAVIGTNRYAEQMLLFDLPPVRVWRNTRKPIGAWSYERELWKVD